MLVVNHWAGDSRYAVYAARLREAFDGRVLAIGAEDGDNRISFAVSGPSVSAFARPGAGTQRGALGVAQLRRDGHRAARLAVLDRMMGRRAGGTRIES